MSDVLESYDRLRVPLNAEQRATRNGPFPYFGANGQVDSIDDYRFDGEFILVAEDGGYFDQPERGVAYYATGKFWVNNHAHVLRARGDMPPRYFLHALNAVDWMQHVGGSTRLKLTAGALERVSLPIPPLNEQRRIVAKLDAVFAQTRAAKARLERLPALIDRLKRSILAAAFRGDLTADWRAANPDVEPASELLARTTCARDGSLPSERNTASTPTPTAAATPPYSLPAGWEWATALDLCGEVVSGSTPAAADMTEVSGDIPFIKVYNLTFDGTLDFSVRPTFIRTDTHEGLLRRSRVRPGDVLMNIVGPPLGKVSIVPADRPAWNINQAIVAFRKTPALSGDLLAYFLMSPVLTQWASRNSKATAGQHNLGVSQCRQLPIPVPPKEEQAVLVVILRSVFSALEKLRSRVGAWQANVAKIERAALAKAFRGELVPQDPADEPAEVLLARLRAAKAEEALVARRSRAAAPAPTYAAPPITLAQAAESGPLFQHTLERRERAAPEPAAQDLVVAALQQSDGRLTAAAIAQTTGLAPAAVRAALKDLIAAGQVHTHGKARGTTYTWAG